MSDRCPRCERARRWRLVVRRPWRRRQQWVYHSETARTRAAAREQRDFLMYWCYLEPQNVRVLAPDETVQALNARSYEEVKEHP